MLWSRSATVVSSSSQAVTRFPIETGRIWLATAGRHWPVGGPEIVAAGVRNRSGDSPDVASSSSATDPHVRAAAARPGREPEELVDADRRAPQRADAAQTVEARRRAGRRSRTARSRSRRPRDRSPRTSRPRAARRRSRPARSTDASKRTCVSCARRKLASSSRQSVDGHTCARSHCRARRRRPAVDELHPLPAPPRRSRSPTRSQRTSSTSTSRARSNASPAWRAPTTRTPMRSPSSSSSSADSKSGSRGMLVHRAILRPRCRDPATFRALVRPLDSQVPPCLVFSRSQFARRLVARDITKSFGPHVVLDGVSFTVGPRSRVGVVAPNGTGKITLLRILAGIDAPDSGTRDAARRPTATVGYLPQEPERRAGETVRAYLAPAHRRGRGRAGARRRARRARRREPAPAPTTRTPTRSSATSRSARPTSTPGSARCCADLGLPERVLDLEMPALSGGQAARASLAAILLARFDVFLLDEPTNDLDFAGLDRLERFLHDELARRRGDRVARPRVPRPHDHDACSSSTSTRTPPPSTRAVGSAYLDEHATARRHAEEDYADVPGAARHADATGPQRAAAVVGAGRGEGREESARPTSSSGSSSATAASTSRPRRRSPTARSNGSRRTRSTSRGRAGTCAWRSRPRPAAARWWPGSPARSCARGDFTLGPDRPRRSSTANGSRSLGANGSGKTTLLDAVARPARRSTSGERWLGPGVIVGELDQARGRVRGRRDRCSPASRPRAGCCRTRRARCSPSSASAPSTSTRPADSLSPGERTRASLALLSARGRQLPRARRADEPSRPARDRAARTGARRLRGHGAARHPRPRAARRGHAHPPRSSSSTAGSSSITTLDVDSATPARVERDRGRGRDVERVGAGLHRDADARVGRREPRVGETRAFRAEQQRGTLRPHDRVERRARRRAGVSANGVNPAARTRRATRAASTGRVSTCPIETRTQRR